MGTVERWRLLVTRGAGGAANMALDESLLNSAANAQGPVHTLRLYWFEPVCLSIGAFQPLAEADQETCAAAGVEVVRRPTGGRAVFHDRSLTYSVTGPSDGAVFADGIRPSYRRVAAALVRAIELLGVNEARATVPVSAAETSPSCFDHVAPYEPVALGYKLAGSAQARRARSALQHGSLRLGSGRIETAALLTGRKGVRSAVTVPDPPSVADLVGREVSMDEAAAALTTGFRDSFSIELCEGDPTNHERADAERLLREKYLSSEWLVRF